MPRANQSTMVTTTEEYIRTIVVYGYSDPTKSSYVAHNIPPPPDPTYTGPSGPIVVQTEEIFIVVIVLILWAGAIALFFNRWGKIRMLEPYQPKFHEEEHRPSCPIVDSPIVGSHTQHRASLSSRHTMSCSQTLPLYQTTTPVHRSVRPREDSTITGDVEVHAEDSCCSNQMMSISTGEINSCVYDGNQVTHICPSAASSGTQERRQSYAHNTIISTAKDRRSCSLFPAACNGRRLSCVGQCTSMRDRCGYRDPVFGYGYPHIPMGGLPSAFRRTSSSASDHQNASSSSKERKSSINPVGIQITIPRQVSSGSTKVTSV